MVRVRATASASASASSTPMEASSTNPDAYRGSSTNSRRYGMLSASNIIQAPISALLEYSSLLRTTRSIHQEPDSLIPNQNLENSTSSLANNGEVDIRIIGAGDHESERDASGMVVGQLGEVTSHNEVSLGLGTSDGQEGDSRSSNRGVATGEEGVFHLSRSGSVSADAEAGVGGGTEVNNSTDSSYQRYDIQQAARWIEQVLPFSLLSWLFLSANICKLMMFGLLQRFAGFFVTIWIAAVMFKSNDILKKQTALKLLSDTFVRQEAMVLKCFLLMYYRNSRGRNYRKQGQMLTLVEYMMLLYRALLPTLVWYRFFLNKDYGSLFSSLMTGLYLTFKLTSVVEVVQSFFAALKALSRKEVHYGAYATSEQVVWI
ncbi:hypothetical protein CRYUN_Cryun29cG0001000 [Craigia yunnanensis]